jgi:mannitol-1-phosphate 5-dehydrogenase
MEPTPEQKATDPLAVQGTDYWQLQVDGDKVRLPFPRVAGIVPVAGFQSGLERKLFTYSTLSATIAYLGYLLGLSKLHEAASDVRVLSVAHMVLGESGVALCHRHKHSVQEQAAHAEESIAAFQNPRNPDTVERHARDPLRKLSRHDRLLGAALLCREEGIEPRSLALVIAAALRYGEPSDPAAVTLQQQVAQRGVTWVLAKICGLPPGSSLATLIRRRVLDVDRFIAGEGAF